VQFKIAQIVIRWKISAENTKKAFFVIGTGTHAVAVIDGNIFDAWDSSHEIPQYYLEKEI
jgi:hypothetical protein